MDTPKLKILSNDHTEQTISESSPVPAALTSDETVGPIGSIRKSRTWQTGIANGEALSGVIDFRDVAGAIVHMPGAWTAADLGFYVCDSATGTFQPLYDETNTIVHIDGATAGRSHVVPADVFAARYVRLWSQNAGANENQGADRVLRLSLKS